MNSIDLTHHFLIAMPAMEDPNFARTLTYVAEHNENGALGVIINRPLDMTVGDLFERVDIPLASKHTSMQSVFFGGPVQTDRGFVLHRPAGEWQSSLRVQDDIALTSSRDILEAMSHADSPFEAIITLGYAGWTPGQLEEEMGKNAWLSVRADPTIIFDVAPEARFEAAMGLLGIDFAKLSETAGHA